MHLKHILQNKVEPLLNNRGYFLSSIEKNSAYFVNADDSIKIGYELSKRAQPELLGQYVDGLQAGKWIRPPLTLKLDFIIKKGSQWRGISPELMRGIDSLYAAFVLTELDAQEVAMHFTLRALRDILPYAEDLEARLVYPTNELYKRLADHTTERARSVSMQHKIPIQATAETLRVVQIYCDSLLPQSHAEYVERFEQVSEELVNVAAFLGQAVAWSQLGDWRWFPLSMKYPGQIDTYVVSLPAKRGNFGDCNPLVDVLEHWNAAESITHSGLYSSGLKDYFCTDQWI